MSMHAYPVPVDFHPSPQLARSLARSSVGGRNSWNDIPSVWVSRLNERTNPGILRPGNEEGKEKKTLEKISSFMMNLFDFTSYSRCCLRIPESVVHINDLFVQL